MPRVLFMLFVSIGFAQPAAAQRITSFGLGTGAVTQSDARTTAGFTLSAGLQWRLPWLMLLQTSVAELHADSTRGTVRDVSLAVLPSWEIAGHRLLLAAGPSLHNLQRDVVDAGHSRRVRVAVTAIAGIRLSLAGRGLMLELLARADALQPEPQFSGLLGVRVHPGLPNTLRRGEAEPEPQVTARAAVWNDVLMQLILLQHGLESFTRIREIETGIELEFDQTAITLYDDIAKAARVLAAADPPVVISVFAPQAGRAGAAVTAGSFPAERMRMQRDDRVFLRVER